MNEENGFIKLRRGLYEHIIDGRMRGPMLSVYVFLHLKADIYTGLVSNVSAPFIAHALHDNYKHIQRQLIKLEKGEYIRRFGHRGQVKLYSVLIHRYLTLNGILIDAVNSNNLNEIAWTPKLNGNLIGTYYELNGNLKGTYLSTIIELKENIKIIKENKKEINNKNIAWKNDFEVYQTYEMQNYETIIRDKQYLENLQAMLPNINILATIEKAHREYWMQEDGWKKKKSGRSDTIDWKATYRKACKLDFNQIKKEETDSFYDKL